MRYPGLSRPVVVQEGCGIEEPLAQVVRGWVPRVRTVARPRGQALACVFAEPSGDGALAVYSLFAEAPFRDLAPASAVCALVADLGQGFFDERPGTIALHCGAVRIGGRLVAVSGPARAGKSTLVARMTAVPGVEVWCDDILPVLPEGMAVGLGVAPRLRLPLPEGASAVFRNHVARVIGPQDGRYGFVCAPSVAPHGVQAPLSALVRLDRRATGPARLFRLDPEEALAEILTRNMAEQETPDAAWERGAALLRGLEAVTLVYADVEEAVALLERAFGAAGGVEACLSPGVPPPPDDDIAPGARPPAATGGAVFDVDTVVHWAGDVVVRRMGGSAFLWSPGGTAIWHLNTVAAAVWALIEIPGSARELAEALAEVYPQVPFGDLLADVAGMVEGFVAAGFALVGPDGGVSETG
jgi:hypothetical protein